MNRLFGKRLLASLFDCYCIAFCAALLDSFIPDSLELKNSITLLVVLILFLVDLTFRNASLGKKIFGLIVLSDEWQVPKSFHVIRRSVIMISIGIILYVGAFVTGKDKFWMLEWEKENLKAQVVEKKVYMDLKEKATRGSSINVRVMDELYFRHLQG